MEKSHPFAEKEAAAHKVGGRMCVAQEAIVGEKPGVLRAKPGEAVVAVLGLGFCRRWSWAQRGKAPPFPEVLSPDLGRWEPQGRVTRCRGPVGTLMDRSLGAHTFPRTPCSAGFLCRPPSAMSG